MRSWLLLLAVMGGMVGQSWAIERRERTVSSSKQFIVESSDPFLRSRVASFGDETKAEVLRILGAPDGWRLPIFIRAGRAEQPKAQPVDLRLFETPDGTRVQIDVQIGADPAEVNLQKHIVRALLLEMSYRGRPTIKSGEAYLEAPWWLVEGIVKIIRQRDFGLDTAPYKAMLEAKRLPDLQELLRTEVSWTESSAAQEVDAMYGRCLLQLLLEQPGGRASLQKLLIHWPQSGADPVAGLTQEFPALGASSSALQKWWTLNVAKLSIADRYRGLSAEATEEELKRLLSFEVVKTKTGEKKTFSIEQFSEYLGLSGGKLAMQEGQSAMVALSAHGNALLRPVVASYEKIFRDLARGKTRGVAERLLEVQAERKAVLAHVEAIADYLNFYEATQMGVRSEAFDGYMKAANAVPSEEGRVREFEAISRYLDELELQF